MLTHNYTKGSADPNEMVPLHINYCKIKAKSDDLIDQI
jgi:hypothetical protein